MTGFAALAREGTAWTAGEITNAILMGVAGAVKDQEIAAEEVIAITIAAMTEVVVVGAVAEEEAEL